MPLRRDAESRQLDAEERKLVVLNMKANIKAIILASGSGARTGLDIPKQFLKIGGRPVLEHTLRAFSCCQELSEVVVVGNPKFLDRTIEIASVVTGLPIRVVVGGKTRQESSYNGIVSCSDASHVIIHDGVRPLISPELIRRIINRLQGHDAIDVCIPSPDTVVVRSGDHLSHIPPRTEMMLGQTPQAFRRDVILGAHEQALSDGVVDSTDDCNLVLRLGSPVYIEQGERTNMKITHLDDLYLVERLFQVGRLRGKPDGQQCPGMDRALVLGGTRGLGYSLSSLFRSHGIQTLAVGRRTTPGVDVCSGTSIRSFISELSRLQTRFDCVVYAAGLLLKRSIQEYSEVDWDSTFETNLKGVFLVLQELQALLRPGGHFMVLGSSSYSLGRAGYAAYSSSKAALINLIQAASDEYPQFRVNVVSPQRANTPLRTAAFGAEQPYALLEPDDVAQRIFTLLGTDLTGMNFDIRVDAPLVPMEQ